jgi:hypothetical protein
MSTFELGSRTAKGGFANEKAVCEKFINWRKDIDAQEWLRIMGYNWKKIDELIAICVPVNFSVKDIEKYGISDDDFRSFIRFKKTDIQVRLMIIVGNVTKIENISLKKTNHNSGKNQVDKRTVDVYQGIWKFDNEIAIWLKLFTGETKPKNSPLISKSQYRNLREKKRRKVFIDEMPVKVQKKILSFFEKNRIQIVSDIIKGRGGLSACWMLVTVYNTEENTTKWMLVEINKVMNFLGSGEIKISAKGSLDIGRIHMQRKGGTPDPTKLQFYIDPRKIFEMV